MKLLNHLNETVELTTEEIGKILLKDCQPFLRELSHEKNMLWRGTYGGASGIKKYPARMNDRHPKDIPIWVHNYLNTLYKQRFGWPVRNGVFCYNYRTTDLYGEPFWMFPIGKYEYLWSPEIDDLFHTFIDFRINYVRTKHLQGVTSIKNDDIRGWCEKIVNSTKYYSDAYGRAEPNNEISINCEEYYIVDVTGRKDIDIIYKMILP